MRYIELEMQLQKALNEGRNVWVVGDVHGFCETFTKLIEKLNIGKEDYVVVLGDLIDRGPNSFGVVQTVRNSPRIFSVKGNHEAMMADHFTLDNLEKPTMGLSTWLYNGGLATINSYIKAYTNLDGQEDTVLLHGKVEEDKRWMFNLPSEIVLDDWRLVHAGYDPEVDMDCQTDSEMLHIRKPFHNAQQPLDPHKTVMFGHSVTPSLPGFNKTDWGSIWRSKILLSDGRPAAIGLDTCVYHNFDGPAVLSAYNLQNGDVAQQCRVEPWNKQERKRTNEI